MVNEINDCIHTLNGNFLNRCFALRNSPVIRSVTNQLFLYFTPTIIMAILVVILLILPYIFKYTSRNNRAKAKILYKSVRFTFLSLFHRITYVFTVVPWMSFLIKEKGPCQCTGLKLPSMNYPYSYSISSAIIGLALFEFASFKPIAMYPLGIFVMFMPSILYILGGWVSIAQATSSLLFAVFLHYFSILTTSYVTLGEDVVLFIANIITLFWSVPFDKSAKSSYKTPSIIHGMGAIVYDFFLTLRFIMKNNWGYGNVTHENVVISKDNTALQSSLINADESSSFLERMNSDGFDGIIAFAIILIFDAFNMVSKGI